jgi:acyl carrier protein
MENISRQQIEKDLYGIIAKLAKTTPEKLNPGDNLREDLGFDSLKSMEAISRVTELYEVDPELDDIVKLKTIKDIIDFMADFLKVAK